MKFFLLIQIFVVLMLGCSNYLKYHYNVIPRANAIAFISEDVATNYAGSRPSRQYHDCVKEKILPYIKNEMINENSSFFFDIKIFLTEYMDEYNDVSPYNYHKFADFVKKGEIHGIYVNDKNEKQINTTLQLWTSVLYDNCGQYAYTIDERCTALAAVDLTPDWCPRPEKKE